ALAVGPPSGAPGLARPAMTATRVPAARTIATARSVRPGRRRAGPGGDGSALAIDPSYGRRPIAVPAGCYIRSMDAFELGDLLARREASGDPYLEFISVPDLSVGLYVLAAGQPDLQRPHTEDETYYVISGRGRVTV